MTFRQKLSVFIGRRLSLRIVRNDRIGQAFEAVHLKKFLKHFKVDCVFDVGANEGQYAEMLRKKAGFKGIIISFEPIPAVAAILRKKAHSDPYWNIEEIALDRTQGAATFNIMHGTQFSSLHTPKKDEGNLFMNQNTVAEKISVTTKTLADVFSKYKKQFGFERPFLKMDTQGHDFAVAEGAGDILKEFIGIQSELSIKPIYEDIPTYDKVLEYYNSKGFELTAFVPNNEGHFPHLIEIDCILHNSHM